MSTSGICDNLSYVLIDLPTAKLLLFDFAIETVLFLSLIKVFLLRL